VNVLILNQFVPPDASPTARLAGDLAALCHARGHRAVLAGAGQSYQTGARGWRRLAGEAAAWAALDRAACAAERPDCIIALSSPPCLLAAAARAARRHRARLVHWAMDLYPETAVALGVLPRAAAPPFAFLMRRAYQSCARVIALDADMAERLGRAGAPPPAIVPPWPPDWEEPSAFLRPAGAPPEARLWMYSGNLGRAHEAAVLIEAQQRLEARGTAWWLVVQGGGAGWEAARAAARGLRQCLFLPHASEAEAPARLAAAEVLAVTRRPAARGLLWPSKLAAALAWPRRIAWIGDTDSAAAAQVRHHPGSMAFASGDAPALADWLCALPPAPLPPLPSGALRRARAEGMERWWSAALAEQG